MESNCIGKERNFTEIPETINKNTPLHRPPDMIKKNNEKMTGDRIF
jgi:hypothetical protein